MKLNTKKLTIAMAVASVCMTIAAYAQETPTPADVPQSDQSADTEKVSSAAAASAAAKSNGIQTVVVTAQKRKEDSSKVPVSISVIGGDELTAQHIGDYADITRAIPNISFSGGGGGGDAGDGPGLSNIEIRGISSSAGSATVGVYMDDVSMNVANLYSMGSAEPKFFDLDHVEVLRGPQGTLYGASSMGGTIKFITNQPDLKQQTTDVYTEFSTMKGGQGSYTGNVVFNEPLIQNELALRFGIQSGHQGGYINQVDQLGNVINYGINWQQDQVMHFALKWTPTKDLTITPNVFYQNVKSGDTDVSYSQVLDNGEPLAKPIYLAPYETSKITREPGSDKLLVPSITVNYDTGVGDITSVSSLFKRTFSRVQDGGASDSRQMQDFAIVNPDLAAAVGALPASVTLDNTVDQFSQEIRMASKPYEKGGAPLTWIVGAYVANEHTNIVENDFIYGINNTFNTYGVSPTDQTQFTSGYTATGFPGDDAFYGNYSIHDTQQSIYGETSYYLTPALHTTFGIRYLRAQEEYTQQQQGFYYGAASAPATISDTSASKTTPKFSVIWEIDPANSVYATAQEGFRVGGANSPLPNYCFSNTAQAGVTPIAPFTPDSLWSYEVGNKSRFLDNRLTVNASLFYVKWKNMQQEIQLECTYNYDVNVGAATSYGAELEVKAKPIHSVLLDLAAGYTHATLDNSEGAETGLVGAIAGASIPGVPAYNIAFTSTYSYDISDEYFGFLRGAARWTGASNGGFNQLPNSGGVIIPPNIVAGIPDPDFNRPAYHTIDLSTGVSWKEWEATLFAKNLFNNNMVIQHPITQTIATEVFRLEPRTVGVSLSAKF